VDFANYFEDYLDEIPHSYKICLIAIFTLFYIANLYLNLTGLVEKNTRVKNAKNCLRTKCKLRNAKFIEKEIKKVESVENKHEN